MKIEGGCHCENIRYILQWPETAKEIPVRECGCTFCRKHGGAWTSHRESVFEVTVEDQSLVSEYQFGTATAGFHVCSKCGVVTFVTSNMDGHLYAVVNTNTFDKSGQFSLSRSPTDFDGEEVSDRLARRKQNWIPNVQISKAGT